MGGVPIEFGGLVGIGEFELVAIVPVFRDLVGMEVKLRDWSSCPIDSIISNGLLRISQLRLGPVARSIPVFP
jgi:hypothetical protein